MTQAIANIDSKSAKSSLTRRAALGGLAVLAVPTAAAAVCVAPGFAGPDAALTEIGRRFDRLDQEARKAWAEWDAVDKPLRYAMIEYERTLSHLSHEARCDALDAHIQAHPCPKADSLYSIANAISDERDAAMQEAFQHKPTTLAGFAVYAMIVKHWNKPLFDTPPDAELDLDQETIRRLVDLLLAHLDGQAVLS